MRDDLQRLITEIVTEKGISEIQAELQIPIIPANGDYATNIALIVSKQAGQQPMQFAEEIKEELQKRLDSRFEKIEIAQPGFINFYLSKDYFIRVLDDLLRHTKKIAKSEKLANKKIIVEYAHPNTHKEMHIGHLRTLITGEALSRLFEFVGAKVFRANYQGDIGLHIAKALYGIRKLLEERDLTINEIESWKTKQKAHFLGEGYARGSTEYENHKTEIDELNTKLYAHDSSIWPDYEKTRQWNLDYYDEFYRQFYTKFDRLFFESEMDTCGKKIVLDHLGDVFVKENGAIIFKGEAYGFHTRVFINSQGNPLYEAKEVCLGYEQFKAFPFDLNIHVVANEQKGYFEVVIKALELLDPKKFKGKEYHLSMGMVQFSDRKISSRTGDVLTVDWLIDEIRAKVEQLLTEKKVSPAHRQEVIEQIVIGAIKYSVLKVGTGQNVRFDIAKSVSLDGDSGPYLQYTFARIQSVLRKSDTKNYINRPIDTDKIGKLLEEEFVLLRILSHFEETIILSAEKYAPNLLCSYLVNLCQQFNLFYQNLPILKGEQSIRDFRLRLTASVGIVIKEGLDILGIQAPDKM